MINIIIYITYNIIIYPFIIDLPYPCYNYNNINNNLSCYFSDSYQTARYKFRLFIDNYYSNKSNHISNRNIERFSFNVIDDLTIDFALIKGNSENLVIHISGTHGTEVCFL